MRVLNTVIKCKKVNISNNNLTGNFQLFPTFTKQIEKLDNQNYTLTLNFEVKSTSEKPFPLDIEASICGTFSFEQNLNEADVENFMMIPAVQIIFPHLRSLVSSVTANCYIQPLLLPLVDPRVFINI